MRKKLRFIVIILCVMFVVSGCGTRAPKNPPSEVVKSYLEALKTQNAQELANYSLSGLEVDNALPEDEIIALGIDYNSAQKFSTHILDFEYELDGESIYLTEESATVTIKLKTYDVNEIVKKSVEDNKKQFAQISEGKESKDVKQKQISDIIIADFEKAERSVEKSYTLQLKIKDKEWKVKDVDETFYKMLWLNES